MYLVRPQLLGELLPLPLVERRVRDVEDVGHAELLYIYIYIYIYLRGGRVLLTEMLLPRIARLASNCSTGGCLSNFNERPRRAPRAVFDKL